MEPEVLVEAKHLYGEFLSLRRTNADISIDEFCESHPRLAPAIRSVHQSWLELTPGSSASSHNAGNQSPGNDDSDSSLDDADASNAATVFVPEGASTPSSNTTGQPATGKSRYELDSEIARGGMGAIYKVWDAELRRHLAMKVILDPPRGTAREKKMFLSRFVEEAQITGQLDHPCVIPVHELGASQDGRPFFTMPLVKGREFKTIIELARAGEEDWTQSRALAVIVHVCEAMAYAHKKGVIHRDLKPANVMVGSFGEVYIMDWGLAKVRGQDAPETAELRSDSTVTLESLRTDRREEIEKSDAPMVTESGTVVGTPAYMPPEQAEGRIDELTHRADVYSVGAILYSLLTGQMPYVTPGAKVSARTVLAAVIAAPPTPIAELDRSVAPELIAICDKAMARDPEHRYEDLRAMAQDLRDFLDQRVVQAYQTGAVAEFRKWVSRNKGMALTSIGMLLLAIAAAGALAVQQNLAARTQAELNEEVTRERDAAAAIADFLEDLFQVPDPGASRGNSVTAREILDKGRVSISSRLADHPETKASLMSTMGRVYRGLGLYDEAEELLQASLETRQSLLGDDHAEVAATKNDLSLVWKSMSKFEEATRLAREALTTRRQLIDGDHADIATSLNDLGWVTYHVGNREEGQNLLKEALEMRRRLFGQDDVAVAESLYRWAWTLQDMGNALEAEPRMRASLAMRRRLLGNDHFDVATSLNTLARLVQGQGHLEEAEGYLDEALTIYRKVLGDSHAYVANCLDTLGSLQCFSMGHHEEGMQSFREAIAIYAEVVGTENLEYGITTSNLAAAYYRQGQLDEAAEHFTIAMRVLEKQEGMQDRVIAICNNLAVCRRALGQYDIAEPLYRRVFDYRSANRGTEDPATAYTACELADCLTHLRRFTEAERLLLDHRPTLERLLGAKDRKHLKTLGHLVRLYENWGKPDQAQPYKARIAELKDE